MKSLLKLFVCLACLAPMALKADIMAAKAAFDKGKALEASKQYAGAITEYESALAAEPSYTKVWRQIGNCRYYSGDKPGALQAYDTYLAANDDAAVRSFADKLRAQVPGAAAAPARPSQPAQDATEQVQTSNATVQVAEIGRFKVGADFGYHTMAFTALNADWKAIVTSGTPPSISAGYSVGLDLGWRVLPPLDLGLDVDYYLAGFTNTITSGSIYEDKIDASYNFLWLGPMIAYDVWTAPSGLRVNVGAGAGYLMMLGATRTDKVTFFGVKSDTNSTYSGTGMGFKAKIGTSWDINSRLDAFFDAGYRIATISKVTYTSTSSGTSSSGTLTRFGPGTSGDMPMEYSGLDLKLGANFRF